MAQKGRLIIDPPRPAATNMAIDSALFSCAHASPLPATLRIYGWSPHAVSIGRRQKPQELDLALCGELGIDVVKRPGGGAAVYHDRELTYAFVCRTADFAAPSPEAWRNVFVKFLERLSIKADPQIASERADREGGACFSYAAEDEPTINGKKFVGSARRKSKTVFLQHGSILLESQPALLRRILKNPGVDGSVGLADLAPGLDVKRASDEFVGAVAETLRIEFVEDCRTAEEALAARINEGLNHILGANYNVKNVIPTFGKAKGE